MSTDSPWSVPLRFVDVARGPVRRELEADDATRRSLARLLGLSGIESLTADVTARPWLDGVEIQGRFDARVSYICSATGEPFDGREDGDFTVRVLPAGSPNAPQEELGEEIDLDPEADDPPDVVEGDVIDLGGYVVEHLSLELDPFPRKPGAVFEPPKTEESASPFAVLRQLRKDDDASE
jgi:uncharacterized metal-binding protein YceD (DUF177 family)